MRDTGGVRQKVFYSFGQIGNGAYNGINNAVLTLFVSGFTSNPFVIGYLGNSRTVEGVVIQPLVGRWSDRTSSPLGRRRPFILFGVPLSVLFLLLVPLVGHTRHNLALPLIAASVILFSITWNIAQDPYSALMVDITPSEERPRFNAILSVLALLGQVGIVVYASVAALKKNNIPDGVFYACAAVMALSYVVVFLGVREPRRAVEAAQVENRIPFRAYVAELQVFREAFKLLVSIFFLWNGLNAILPFISTFPIKIVHASKSQALVIYVVIILSSAVFAYPFGWLGARYGNRRMIALGTTLLIASAILGLVVPTYFWLFPLAILAGCGFSATTVLTYPYLSQLIPGSKIGLFTGLQTAFSAVAVPLSTVLTGTLIDLFGYRSIFAMLAVMMVFDILVLLAIDERAAREQVRQVEERERLMAGGAHPAPAERTVLPHQG
ncbi:MAG: MFS transporter [Chloroflexi bacterium]|nr:MFS transporter [Chloroflexota bacterium]